MSTKSSLFYDAPEGDHKLQIHIYEDMHESKEVVVVELSCSTCYCSYKFLMDEHLARQLVDKLSHSKTQKS